MTIQSIISIIVLLLLSISSICDAYRPGDIVPLSRMGQYHNVISLFFFSICWIIILFVVFLNWVLLILLKDFIFWIGYFLIFWIRYFWLCWRWCLLVSDLNSFRACLDRGEREGKGRGSVKIDPLIVGTRNCYLKWNLNLIEE